MRAKYGSTIYHKRTVAFLISIPIGLLGGLIGLGGAEFRLPVLIGVLHKKTREAVPFNLSFSLITIVTSLIIRLKIVTEFPFMDLLPVLLSMIVGAVIAAFITAGVANKISSQSLETWMKFLLISIGLLLIFEGFVPINNADLLQRSILVQSIVGIIAGILIGIVSSSLGVAGGELIIPTLIFIFGIGVKIAGTASLLISLPTVLVGLFRYHHIGNFFNREGVSNIVIPMGAGSVIGSVLGGLLFSYVSQNGLKILLGVVLIYSAYRIFFRSKAIELKNE
ncbi:MAG: sulfite exporter TauE/SafE family protein [Anaerolineaceae bacterium]|nr:sulfite exporter TauE/SafE family protein [Anaerolineaceae bacterium]